MDILLFRMCSTMKKNSFINEILNDMFVMFFFFLISSWKEGKSIVILMIGRERKRDIRLDKFQF